MKKLVAKKDSSLRVWVDENGFYKNFIQIPIKKKDSFLIKDELVPLKFQSPNGNEITNKFWELINPINGDRVSNRKYIGVDNNTFDVVSISDIIGNKNKVQTITAFDGVDLSNIENLDSGFDGFFN